VYHVYVYIDVHSQLSGLSVLALQHLSGLEEAVLRNIDACKELADTTRSAYGPFGKIFKELKKNYNLKFFCLKLVLKCLNSVSSGSSDFHV